MGLIHALLQSHFDGRFRVDFNRVVLAGGSGGTYFLHAFVQRYGEHYGGGLLADCGHQIVRRQLWNPSSDFRDRFRVFIRSTLGDPGHHAASMEQSGYYRYTVGLETKTDLSGRGPHCSRGAISDLKAVEWALGRHRPRWGPCRAALQTRFRHGPRGRNDSRWRRCALGLSGSKQASTRPCFGAASIEDTASSECPRLI